MKTINDNGAFNDDNAAGDSSEEDICAISSNHLINFSNCLE